MDVGLVVNLTDSETLGRPFTWAETRELALRAEAAGLDSLWLADHLLYRDPGEPTQGIWECWTFLSALAEATSRVQLGTLVNCVLFRNPALLAKMAVTLDEVSGGRFTLGLGAGWNAPEFAAFGLPFDHRTSRLEEAVQVIAPLLKEGHVDFAGTYYSVQDCELAPRGPRSQGIPLLFGAWGPRSLQLTARYGSNWNAGYLSQESSLREAFAAVDAACREVGRDPSTLARSIQLAVTFPDLGGPAPQVTDALQINESQRVRYESIAGTPQELAARFVTFEGMGISDIMIQPTPFNETVIDRLAEARRIHREMSAQG